MSIQTTGFQLGPGTELAIEKLLTIDFVFTEPIFVVIVLLEGLSLSFLAEATMFFLPKMSWYLVELIMPLILTRAPGPLAAEQPQSIQTWYQGMMCFSLYVSFF